MNIEEVSFPVVYAPKVEKFESTTIGKPVDILVPAKGYLVGQAKDYTGDENDNRKTVVFCCDGENKDITPKFIPYDKDDKENVCINANLVGITFDDFLICNSYVFSKNMENLGKLLRQNPENMYELEKEFGQNLITIENEAIENFLQGQNGKADCEEQVAEQNDEQLTLF
jgi:hypothetical protein